MAEVAAYNLNLASEAEVEDRIAGLKILAAFTPKPIDKQRCIEEIVRLRSSQLQAAMRAPHTELNSTVGESPCSSAAPAGGPGQPR